jgi:glucose-1-phosphate cytidylyltransferase
MKNLAHFGITDFIVATGYKSDMIKEYFLNYEARNNDFTLKLGDRDSLVFHNAHEEAKWRVTVTFTGDSTPTGGRVLAASKYLDDEPFLVTYGDGLANVNVTDLIRFHQASGSLATITTVQPLSRFGVMDVTEAGQVISFREKPQLEGWINVGFFVMEPAVLAYFNIDTMLEDEPLMSLASKGLLSAYRHEGFWQPMDTFREAKQLNEYWESGTVPWKSWE